ncbi:hypothetical protein J2X90_005060 [Variovorax paradoxus]|nr:hypothetical protein [Variovorax paradoxus]
MFSANSRSAQTHMGRSPVKRHQELPPWRHEELTPGLLINLS